MYPHFLSSLLLFHTATRRGCCDFLLLGNKRDLVSKPIDFKNEQTNKQSQLTFFFLSVGEDLALERLLHAYDIVT